MIECFSEKRGIVSEIELIKERLKRISLDEVA